MNRTAPWILFLLHDPQIGWLGPVADHMSEDEERRTILWVVGPDDRRAGKAEPGFDEVVDLLEGFTPERDDPPLEDDLGRLREFEERHPASRINESAAIARHFGAEGWSRDRIIRYASHLTEAMEDEVEIRGSPPLALIGENNALRYRLAHGLFEGEAPHWLPLSPRHMLDRFYLSDAQSERWTACVEAYEQICRTVIPEGARDPAEELFGRITRQRRGPKFTAGRPREALLDDLLDPGTVAKSVLTYLSQRGDTEPGRDPRVRPVSELHPAKRLRERLVHFRRARAFHRLASHEPSAGRFATYFLHVRPEYNVDGRAFPYRKQPTAIENIAAALPADMTLAVKEHSPMVGRRPKSYYDTLCEAPNVEVLSDTVDSFALIEQSEIAFTLVGTVALEAMALGTPAVVFGDVYFGSFKGIHKAESLCDLPGLVNALLSDPEAGATKEEALEAFAAMHFASHPGKFGDHHDEAEIRSAQNVKRLSDVFREAIDSLDGR